MRSYFVRVFFIFSFLSVLSDCRAQDLLRVDLAKVSFVSEAPLERIAAATTEVEGVLDPSTQKFAFKIVINSFLGFNSALQRIHFQENYMETEKFAAATFSGRILDDVDIKNNGVYQVRAKGTLQIRGIERDQIIPLRLVVEDGAVRADASFSVLLDHYNIRVPRIVSQKIAKEINVEVSVRLQ